jgi:hypothetical protein
MINILDIATLQRIINDINSNENMERKKKEYKAELVFDGLQKNYVKERLRLMYEKTWQLYTVSDYNIFRKIVKKISKAYKENPRRVLENTDMSGTYETICQAGSLNEALRDAEKILNKHRYGLIGAYFEPINGLNVPKFIAIPPYQYDVVKDDYGNLECVILSYQQSEIQQFEDGDLKDQLIASMAHEEGVDQKVYSIWTAENHLLVKVMKREGDTQTRLEIVPIPNNPNNLNPYGMLNFYEFPVIGSNYPRNNTLADNSIELNTLLSVYYTSANMQIGQLVLKFPADKKVGSTAHGLMNVLHLPQSTDPNDPETEAQYISPAPNLSGHREAIVTMMNSILDEYNISSNGVVNDIEKFSSGFDRLLSNADIQDYIEEVQGIFRKAEEFIFDLMNSANNNMFGDEFNVIYAKPKVLITDTEKLNNIKLAYELGVIQEHEKLMIFDPNLNENQAKEKLQMIREEKVSTSDSSFNGAQVQAIVTLVEKVSAGIIERDAAVKVLSASFGIAEEIAATMIPEGINQLAKKSLGITDADEPESDDSDDSARSE